MPINSRAKGARGEREWRDQLRNEGFDARRGQQFSGGTDSPDVICDSLPGIHWEVKRVQAGNPYMWMEQAERDAGTEKMPIVAHKRNGKGWLCVIRAEDLFALLRETNQPLIITHATNEQGNGESAHTPNVRPLARRLGRKPKSH
jgi:Holliday junction resolvase